MFAYRMILIGLFTFALAGCSDDTEPHIADKGVPPK